MEDTQDTRGPVVEARGLVRQYGAVRALDGLDLTVPGGMIYGLLGPNGAGKTTLIRCLLGLVRPDAGSLRVLGHAFPAGTAAVRAATGYMTQAPALYADLSVAQNLAFFARVLGVPAGEREGRIADVLRLVELLDRKDSAVANLSGGMRQRLSLACALIHQPRLLLLD